MMRRDIAHHNRSRRVSLRTRRIESESAVSWTRLVRSNQYLTNALVSWSAPGGYASASLNACARVRALVRTCDARLPPSLAASHWQAMNAPSGQLGGPGHTRRPCVLATSRPPVSYRILPLDQVLGVFVAHMRAILPKRVPVPFGPGTDGLRENISEVSFLAPVLAGHLVTNYEEMVQLPACNCPHKDLAKRSLTQRAAVCRGRGQPFYPSNSSKLCASSSRMLSASRSSAERPPRRSSTHAGIGPKRFSSCLRSILSTPRPVSPPPGPSCTHARVLCGP